MKLKPRYFVVVFSIMIIILSFFYLAYVLYSDYKICRWQGDMGETGLLSCGIYGFSKNYKGEIENCSSYDPDITDDLTPMCELSQRVLRYPFITTFIIFFSLGIIPLIVLYLRKHFHKKQIS